MTLQPCLDCGEVSDRNRCPQHRPKDHKPNAAARGYDRAWRNLSERARRLSPFCEDCGSVDDLQTDHSPIAWARKAEGKRIRLTDVAVVCGRCNRARGAARTRGDDPHGTGRDPGRKAKFRSHIGEAV